MVLSYLEPFLPGFWQENITEKLTEALRSCGKELVSEPYVEFCFSRFYRVMRFDVKP
jgi:hypothetical protein